MATDCWAISVPASVGSTFVMGKHPGQQNQFGMSRVEFGQHDAYPRPVGSQFLAQRSKVADLVPMEVLQVENELVSAAGQRFLNPLG